MNSEPSDVRGLTVPRLWTPPLRDLSDPDATYGYDLIEYAREIDCPFDEYQEWLAIHGGELLMDGRPRFRVLLILISRQQGKTHFAKVLTSFWLHVDLPGTRYRPTVLGTSSKLNYAQEVFEAVVDMSQSSPLLADEVADIRRANGEQEFITTHGTRYKIAAANTNAGRSLTVSRLVMDEVRQLKDWVAYSAAAFTTNAVPDAQIVLLSNQGDDGAVVLDSLRTSALEFIETGEGDPRLGLFEWSAPDGSDPTDVQALAQANPNLNHPSGRNPLDALIGDAIRAKAAGGEQLAMFKIENMCMRVHQLNPAIDPGKWKLCAVPDAGPDWMEGLRPRLALALDVSLDGRHATLTAAALKDGKVRLAVVKTWSGPDCTKQLRADLPALVRKLRPRALGWLPAGPAAAVAAQLTGAKWPPGVTVDAIRSEVPAVCMGFAELVQAEEVEHPDDPLLNQHVFAAQKLLRGDAWVYARQGSAPIDASYSAATATHLARTLPPSIGKPRLIVAGQDS
jgi:hypothetical protein